MKYGIIPLTIVPGRQEPTSKSEQITQFLFGEAFEVLEETINWIFVKGHHDGYQCWIEKAQSRTLSEEDFAKYANAKHAYSLDMTGIAISETTGEHSKVVLASTLPFYDGKQFKIGEETFTWTGTATSTPLPNNEETILPLLKMYLNTPYLWGGRSPFGIDCSGFVGAIMRLCGKSLPRDAYQQAENGESIEFAESAQFGDLAYFDNEEGHITHVGWVLSDGKIMHAASRVKIDKIDHQGIFDVEQKKYSHKLRIIRRISF